ncbi:unannotated protein [freshwater metagenome]|uniref:Unannotated protein n=1 Tax=freshwater metagenome TaxID=449393 RepID=A0A6J6FMT4_9ZZZZ
MLGSGPSVKFAKGLCALADTWMASAPADWINAAASAVSAAVRPSSGPYSCPFTRTSTG